MKFAKALIGAFLGCLPEVLLIAILGVALTVGEVKLGRVGRLFFAVLIAKNIPSADGVYDWVDGEPSEEISTEVADVENQESERHWCHPA